MAKVEKKKKYYGLAMICNRDVYCFSATMSNYWSTALIKACLARKEDITYFEPSFKILEQQQEIDVVAELHDE